MMKKAFMIPLLILGLCMCGCQGNSNNSEAEGTTEVKSVTAAQEYSNYVPHEVEEIYENDGEINIYKYYFDEKGLPSRYEEVDKDGNVIEWLSYEIVSDEHGCPIEVSAKQSKGSKEAQGHIVAEKQMIDGKTVYVFNDESLNDEITIMYVFDYQVSLVKPLIFADCAILIKNPYFVGQGDYVVSRDHQYSFNPDGDMIYNACEKDKEGKILAQVETRLNSYGAITNDEWYCEADYYAKAGTHNIYTYTSEGMRYLTSEKIDPDSGEKTTSEFIYDKKTIDGMECYCTSEESDAQKYYTYAADDNRLLGFYSNGENFVDTYKYTY